MNGLIQLELNEITFSWLLHYIDEGRLPHFARFLETHGWCTTTSESSHEELEPWIQWVTAHTGLTLADHGVFRLGDFPNTRHDQIWERVERELGLRVAAVSPMNAANRAKWPAFFVPDLWTETPVTGGLLYEELHRALRQAVNDNARRRLSLRSIAALVATLTTRGRARSFGRYAHSILTGRSAPWRRALLLDRLLADVFVVEWMRHRPDYSTLFLNAGAHIQHHYLFSSDAYDGPHAHANEHVPEGVDPLLEVYEQYDAILGEVLSLPDSPRVLLATGLSQTEYHEETHYWRLRNHDAFLKRVGCEFVRVRPRMSRDFLVECKSMAQARVNECRLVSARADDGLPIFEVDNRGRDLFCTLSYPRRIDARFDFSVDDRRIEEFDRDVAWVALKNAGHHGHGMFSDSGLRSGELPISFPLHDLPERTLAILGGPPAPLPSHASTRPELVSA